MRIFNKVIKLLAFHFSCSLVIFMCLRGSLLLYVYVEYMIIEWAIDFRSPLCISVFLHFHDIPFVLPITQ